MHDRHLAKYVQLPSLVWHVGSERVLILVCMTYPVSQYTALQIWFLLIYSNTLEATECDSDRHQLDTEFVAIKQNHEKQLDGISPNSTKLFEINFN